TFTGGAVYYDSIAMFVFLLLAARHLERAALARASEATEALAQLLPRRALRLTANGHEEVDCAALGVGDVVSIGVGEAAPATASRGNSRSASSRSPSRAPRRGGSSIPRARFGSRSPHSSFRVRARSRSPRRPRSPPRSIDSLAAACSSPARARSNRSPRSRIS